MIDCLNGKGCLDIDWGSSQINLYDNNKEEDLLVINMVPFINQINFYGKNNRRSFLVVNLAPLLNLVSSS